MIGALLGSVYRGELAGRVRLGRLDLKAHAVWRAQRKQALTAVSSSRWAGAITAWWRISTSWGCGDWPPRSRICALRWRCWRLGACCVPESSHRSRTAEHSRPVAAPAARVSQRRGTVHQDPPPSGAADPVGRAPRRHWLRVGRRSRSVGNACGAPATTSRPAEMTEQQWRDRWDSGADVFDRRW